MATSTVAADERGAYSKTLTASTVDTVTVTKRAGQADYSTRVEVTNLDGAAAIYFTVDGSAPTVGGAKTFELPAAVGSREISTDAVGSDAVVKLISVGTPKYSVARVG